MQKFMEDALQIRYVKLHFTVEMLEDTELPKYKASGIRGGLGEMLLRANCIRNRNCSDCDFFSDCPVEKIMYSQMEIKPDASSTGDSIGYVIECENYETEWSANDRLNFQITLFGKNILYFNLILQAISLLGMSGLGKERSHFRVVEVKNSRKQDILSGNQIRMENYKIQTIAEYVSYRLSQIEKQNDPHNRILFHTPTTLKFNREQLREFHMEGIYRALIRRIYWLDCFEGIESKLNQDLPYIDMKIAEQRVKEEQVWRYSNRHQTKMGLKGIRGQVILEESIPEELLPLFLAGEIVHIGKNTSFGFGRYTIL